MEIEEIRRERLREAAKDLGGPAKLAAKINRSESQVSQLIGKTPTRNFSGELAREFEQSLGKPPYWLERSYDVVQQPASEYDIELKVIIEQWPDLTADQRKKLAAAALLGEVAMPGDSVSTPAANEENVTGKRGGVLRLHKPRKPPG